jgi:hypothetical protein
MSGREFIRLDTAASGEFSVASVPTEPNLATGSSSPVCPRYTAHTGGTLRGGESYTMKCARWLKQ